MRAEIQQAVGLLKSEAENATASKNPLATKLLGVADNLQNVEKDLAIKSAWGERERRGKKHEKTTCLFWEGGAKLEAFAQNGRFQGKIGIWMDLGCPKFEAAFGVPVL